MKDNKFWVVLYSEDVFEGLEVDSSLRTQIETLERNTDCVIDSIYDDYESYRNCEDEYSSYARHGSNGTHVINTMADLKDKLRHLDDSVWKTKNFEGSGYVGWMVEALKSASNSPDASTQNGAIVIWEHPDGKSEIELSRGWNTFQGNVEHVQEPRAEKLYRIEHAERMAIWNFFENIYNQNLPLPAGYSLRDGTITLICPWAACSDCSRAIVGAKINKLVRLELVANETNGSWARSCDVGDEIMLANNVEIVNLPNDGRYGIEIRRAGKLRKF